MICLYIEDGVRLYVKYTWLSKNNENFFIKTELTMKYISSIMNYVKSLIQYLFPDPRPISGDFLFFRSIFSTISVFFGDGAFLILV